MGGVLKTFDSMGKAQERKKEKEKGNVEPLEGAAVIPSVYTLPVSAPLGPTVFNRTLNSIQRVVVFCLVLCFIIIINLLDLKFQSTDKKVKFNFQISRSFKW